MQFPDEKVSPANETLNTLLLELKEECENVLALIHQLQLAELSDNQ
jgi:hypothetical protein